MLRQRLVDRLGQAKIDHLRHRLAIVQADQNVRGLEVPVNDPFLMSVLDRLTNLPEQLESLLNGHPGIVAVRGKRNSLHILHHKEWPPMLGQSAIENLGDVGMIHQGQCLPLGLEP